MRRISQLFLCFILFLLVVGCTQEQTVDSKTILPDGIPEFVNETDIEEIDWNQKAADFGENGIIGNENKSGVIGADMPSLQEQKWMWHLWGTNDAEKLTVVGFHKESETIHQIIKDQWTIELGGANNGADAHIPSTVKIPEPGEWGILLYVDGKLFDTLVYEITE